MVLIGVIFWMNIARSMRQGNGTDITITNANNVEGDLITAGRNITVNTQIDGDLTVAGSKITVAQSVEGYVIAAGSSVRIDGEVSNDLYAAAEKIIVNSSIEDNAFVAGRSILLQPGARIGNDARIAGEEVQILSPIEGNLKVGAGTVRIASEIGGTIEAHTEKLQLLPGAKIHGNVIVHGSNAPEISKDAQILGRVENQFQKTNGWSWWACLMWFLFSFSSIFILGSVLLMFSRPWLERTGQKIVNKPLSTLIIGFITLIAVPLLCLLLFFSVVGIPLGIVLFALWITTLLLSCVFVSYLVGKWLIKLFKSDRESTYGRLALGGLLVAFLTALPWLGWIVQTIVVIGGIGGLVLERREVMAKVSEKSVHHPAA
jgi:cytoskeletal protein CcmA (bactofilin family)